MPWFLLIEKAFKIQEMKASVILARLLDIDKEILETSYHASIRLLASLPKKLLRSASFCQLSICRKAKSVKKELLILFIAKLIYSLITLIKEFIQSQEISCKRNLCQWRIHIIIQKQLTYTVLLVISIISCWFSTWGRWMHYY